MKNIKILKAGSKLSGLLSLILLLSLNLKAQNSSTQKLYVCLNDAEPNTKQFLAANHIDNLVSLDQRYIDPHNTHQLDVQTLTNAIIQQIPDSSSTGIAILDLEGSVYDGLDYKLNANSDEYKQIIKFYIQTIKLAKSLRPNTKWGFYGMPFTARQKADDRWKTSNNNISPILQLCDVFCPSLYINGVESRAVTRFLLILICRVF